MWKIILAHSNPVIFYNNFIVCVFLILRIQLINGYCDLSMRIGILDGIADNIQNNFLHLCFITQDLIVDHIQAALIFQRLFCKG